MARRGALSIAGLILLMVGCGGGGGSTSDTGLVPGNTNPAFVGRWQGTYEVTLINQMQQHGFGDVTIQLNSSVSGHVRNDTAHLSGSYVGRVDKYGKTAGHYYMGQRKYDFFGEISISSKGHLIGTENDFYDNEFIGTATFDLTKQVTP